MMYVFFNWKMYLDVDQSMMLLHDILPIMQSMSSVQFGIFPSLLALSEVQKACIDTSIIVGAQSIYPVPQGAYTGAVSAYMVRQLGCTHALVGHSEQRYIFGDKNKDVRKKIDACIDVSLTPVVCVGEKKDDDVEKRDYRIRKQLMAAFDNNNSSHAVIAYEPVGAIGSGHSMDAREAHERIMYIKQEMTSYTKESFPVLYGGSVDASNVVSYLTQPAIEGVLIGSASTTKASCLALLDAIALI